MTTIGENIRKWREVRGLSQEQLAHRIGKTRSAVSQYESGKIIPRMGAIEDMARVLGVKKAEIIGGSFGYSSATLDDEHELLDIFHVLNARDRDALLTMARALARK